jgi:hypothetical protein
MSVLHGPVGGGGRVNSNLLLSLPLTEGGQRPGERRLQMEQRSSAFPSGSMHNPNLVPILCSRS